MCAFSQTLDVRTLEKTIIKGFKAYGEGKAHLENLKYASSCIKLGDYYYNQSNYPTALKYYKLLADLQGHHADGDFFEDDLKLIRLHKVALKKAGLMILEGKGTRADTLESFSYLDRNPNEFSLSERCRFSQDIFGHTLSYVTLKTSEPDTTIQIAINPFFIYDMAILEVDKEFKYFEFQLEKDTSKICNISLQAGFHSFFSEFSSYVSNRFLGTLFTPHNSRFFPRYSFDLLTDNSQFLVSSIPWPVLNIQLTSRK